MPRIAELALLAMDELAERLADHAASLEDGNDDGLALVVHTPSGDNSVT